MRFIWFVCLLACIFTSKGSYCARKGFTWSCCGAMKYNSVCTAPRVHPTYLFSSSFWFTSKVIGLILTSRRPTLMLNVKMKMIVSATFG